MCEVILVKVIEYFGFSVLHFINGPPTAAAPKDQEKEP